MSTIWIINFDVLIFLINNYNSDLIWVLVCNKIIVLQAYINSTLIYNVLAVIPNRAFFILHDGKDGGWLQKRKIIINVTKNKLIEQALKHDF